MAIKVSTQATVDFGLFAAAATVTHLRLQPATVSQQRARRIVKAFPASISVGANERFQIAAGDISITYPRGDLTDTHIEAMVDPLWDSVTWQIDAMTSASTPVAVSGYSQQTYDDWDISTVSD